MIGSASRERLKDHLCWWQADGADAGFCLCENNRSSNISSSNIQQQQHQQQVAAVAMAAMANLLPQQQLLLHQQNLLSNAAVATTAAAAPGSLHWSQYKQEQQHHPHPHPHHPHHQQPFGFQLKSSAAAVQATTSPQNAKSAIIANQTALGEPYPVGAAAQQHTAAATSPAATATQCRRQGRALSLSSVISHPQMVYNLYIINTLMNYYSLMKNGLK